MTRLSDIPARFHAALAAERVDTDAGPLVELRDGDAIVYTRDFGARRYDPAVLTLPPTAHNVRALAVVLAQACGLDVSGGVTAFFDGVVLWLRGASGEIRTFWPEDVSGQEDDRAHHVPALAYINPDAPDALFRALVAALCALETAP